VDFFGEPSADPVRRALKALGRRAGFLRTLGTYPSGRLDWVGTDAPLFPAGRARD
jgi:prephenate dehydratase